MILTNSIRSYIIVVLAHHRLVECRRLLVLVAAHKQDVSGVQLPRGRLTAELGARMELALGAGKVVVAPRHPRARHRHRQIAMCVLGDDCTLFINNYVIFVVHMLFLIIRFSTWNKCICTSLKYICGAYHMYVCA